MQSISNGTNVKMNQYDTEIFSMWYVRTTTAIWSPPNHTDTIYPIALWVYDGNGDCTHFRRFLCSHGLMVSINAKRRCKEGK